VRQAIVTACLEGTLTSTTVAMTGEACRNRVTEEFLSEAAPGTAVPANIDMDWLASQLPAEVCVCACVCVCVC
jgi:hypothetical protein